MSTDPRIAELSAADPQFAAAAPIAAVAQAVEKPGMRLPEIVQTVLAGYADRVALGQRAVELVEENGRTVARLLPQFDTITYGELWERVRAVAAALHGMKISAALHPGVIMDVAIDANGDLDRESFLVEAKNGKQEVRETLPALGAK